MIYVAVKLTPDGAEKIDRKTGKVQYVELGDYGDAATALKNALVTLGCSKQVGMVVLKGENRGGYIVMSMLDYDTYYGVGFFTGMY